MPHQPRLKTVLTDDMNWSLLFYRLGNFSAEPTQFVIDQCHTWRCAAAVSSAGNGIERDFFVFVNSLHTHYQKLIFFHPCRPVAKAVPAIKFHVRGIFCRVIDRCILIYYKITDGGIFFPAFRKNPEVGGHLPGDREISGKIRGLDIKGVKILSYKLLILFL